MQKQQFRFERLIIKPTCGVFENVKYFPQVLHLYKKYLRNLEDDFSSFYKFTYASLFRFIEKTSPHFYLVLLDDEVCGFFCLENIIGTNSHLHSAEVVTCFAQKYWGTFTKYAGKIFRDFCFDILGIYKLKALIYPQNFRVKAILKACDFDKEAHLKGETLKNGVRQDIEIYSVYNPGPNKEETCN